MGRLWACYHPPRSGGKGTRGNTAQRASDTGDDMGNAIPAALSKSYIPYTVTTEAGTEYRITIKKEDMTLFTIDDPDGDIICGDITSL